MSGTPIRTCVGCGARAAQTALLRLVRADHGLAPDPCRRLPGRGAWLHRERSCWSAFAARRGPVRSLRATPSRAARQALIDALQAARPEGSVC